MLTLLRFVVLWITTEPLSFILVMSLAAVGLGLGIYYAVTLIT